MPFSKGREKTGGRIAGTPNKLQTDVKAMILAALEAAGGAAYLKEQSKRNPQAFMTLVGRVLPLQHSIDPEQNKIIVEVRKFTE